MTGHGLYSKIDYSRTACLVMVFHLIKQGRRYWMDRRGKKSLKIAKFVELVFMYCRCCKTLRSYPPSSYKTAPPLLRFPIFHLFAHQGTISCNKFLVIQLYIKQKSRYLLEIFSNCSSRECANSDERNLATTQIAAASLGPILPNP